VVNPNAFNGAKAAAKGDTSATIDKLNTQEAGGGAVIVPATWPTSWMQPPASWFLICVRQSG